MSIPSFSASTPMGPQREPLWGGEAQPGQKGTVEAGGRTYQWEQTNEGVWLTDEGGNAAFVRNATLDTSTGTINGQPADAYLPSSEPAGAPAPLW
jgi:hypothetical protein